MIDKLEAIQRRFEDVSHELQQPDVLSDLKRYKALNKEYKELDRIVTEYKGYQTLLHHIEGARQVIYNSV